MDSLTDDVVLNMPQTKKNGEPDLRKKNVQVLVKTAELFVFPTLVQALFGIAAATE